MVSWIMKSCSGHGKHSIGVFFLFVVFIEKWSKNVYFEM